MYDEEDKKAIIAWLTAGFIMFLIGVFIYGGYGFWF